MAIGEESSLRPFLVLAMGEESSLGPFLVLAIGEESSLGRFLVLAIKKDTSPGLGLETGISSLSQTYRQSDSVQFIESLSQQKIFSLCRILFKQEVRDWQQCENTPVGLAMSWDNVQLHVYKLNTSEMERKETCMKAPGGTKYIAFDVKIDFEETKLCRTLGGEFAVARVKKNEKKN